MCLSSSPSRTLEVSGANVRTIGTTTPAYSGYTALGHTVPEVDLQSLGVLHLATVEKSLFSMCTAEVDAYLKQHNFKSVIVMGIEVRPNVRRKENFSLRPCFIGFCRRISVFSYHALTSCHKDMMYILSLMVFRVSTKKRSQLPSKGSGKRVRPLAPARA